MYEFDYTVPDSVDNAVTAMRTADDGKFLAGGMTLLPTLKLRLAQPTDLVDLRGIAAMRGIEFTGRELVIGAMTAHAEVAASAEVRQRIPALASLAGGIGDRQVRNRGTLGGSVANNDPAADYPAALVGLGATVQTDRRDIDAEDFFTDMFGTALEVDELVVRVRFTLPDQAAYVKFPNPASRYAIVGVMVARIGASVRVAVTGAAPRVFRVPEMEAALAKDFSPSSVAGITVSGQDFNSDLHATAEYRSHLVGVMTRRAVTAASAG